MNIHRRGLKYAKKLADRQAGTRRMISHALQIAGRIIALQGRVSIEWPAGAGAWHLPEVVEFLARRGMRKVLCHGCAFGLKGKEHLLKNRGS